MSKRVIFWRHGQTIWNAEHRFQGQTDIELDETGLAQAERAARLLAALKPDSITSSDLIRAAATAAPLARLTGLTVSYDKDLRERHGGSWEGLTDAEIRARFPAEHAAWMPADGEQPGTVAERVSAAALRAVDQLDDGGVAVVVSHGGSIRFGLASLLGLTEEHFNALGPISNCSWSVVGTGHRGWRLLEYNAGNLPEPVLGDDR
jgi:glucosyl-3-phosphoglycerate phosphatase